MGLLVGLVVNTLAVFTASIILPGVNIDTLTNAVVVAIVLGVLNSFVKPVILLLALPLTILTMGLFSFVVTALFVILIDNFIPGFSVSNFWWALGFSLVVSLVSSFLGNLTKTAVPE